MKHPIRMIRRTLGILIAAILLIVIIYLAYVFISYHRIEDNQELDVNLPKDPLAVTAEYNQRKVETDAEYTIGTYNVGFGAYLPDYSFFMDGGKYSRCYNKESGIDAIQEAAKLALDKNPDFMMFQEVDRDSTRSWHVNQEELISTIFDRYYETYAVNYDSAYLFYPFHEPIGKSYSGLVLYSTYDITSSLRRSLPISTGVSKFLDLDRCYSINRVNADNGKELVLFDVHLSAYGNSDEIRTQQLSMLFGDMKKEVEAGNYVICGGDFNHNLKVIDETANGDTQSWAYPFPRSEMPEGLEFAMDRLSEAEREALPETGRNDDMEYIPGITELFTLDGFIISDNVKMIKYEVEDTGFLYSDHEPVFMTFKLED